MPIGEFGWRVTQINLPGFYLTVSFQIRIQPENLLGALCIQSQKPGLRFVVHKRMHPINVICTRFSAPWEPPSATEANQRLDVVTFELRSVTLQASSIYGVARQWSTSTHFR